MDNCNSLEGLLESLSDFGVWEEEVAKLVNDSGCKLSQRLLEAMDDYLAQGRDKGLRHVGYRSRTLICRFGPVSINRRLYRDSQGHYRFLLDEALGLPKKRSLSPTVSALATALAAHLPFRVAAHLLSNLLPETISHQAIHQMVQTLGERKLQAEEKEKDGLFGFGLHPPSQNRHTETLFLEADGVGVSLQREARARAEIKVGVAYSAKAAGRTVDKVIHLALESGSAFWQGFTIKVAKVFDLSRVRKVTIGGDGASWVKEGKSLFAPANFCLDRFHLRRAITAALGWTKAAKGAYEQASQGQLGPVLQALDQAQAKAGLDKTETIRRTKRYLILNARELNSPVSLGTIESNVDKLVANRMKKRGMSWTIAGAQRMLKLIELNLASEIPTWIGAPRETLSSKGSWSSAASYIKNSLGEDPEAWLRAHLAPLDGPHASRPWVKILRQIARGSESTRVVAY